MPWRGFCSLLVLAAPAYGQDTGTYISAPLEWGTAAAWADANADGKADYCRLVSGPRAACTLSTGAGFGATIASDTIDAAHPEVRVWGDVDGDDRADFCRRVGDGSNGRSCNARARPARASSPTRRVPLAVGAWPDTALVDARATARADYCRLTGAAQTPNVTCTPFGGAPLGDRPDQPRRGTRPRLGGLRRRRPRGLLPRRERRPRVCTTSPARTITSFALDAGYAQGRAWADVNGDGKADYCRRVGDRPEHTHAVHALLRQRLRPDDHLRADRVGPGHGLRLGGLRRRRRPRLLPRRRRLGHDLAAVLHALDGRGRLRRHPRLRRPRPRFRRPIRAWVDHNGDHLADYCRRVGNGGADERISCTISNGTGFGLASPPPPPPPAPAPTPPAPVKPARIVVTIDYFLSRGRLTRFNVKGAPRNARLTVKCPKHCSRKSYTVRKTKGTVKLKTKLFGGRRIRVGTKVTVTVTRAGEIGAVKQWTMRSGRHAPRITTRCLPPGTKKPKTRC